MSNDRDAYLTDVSCDWSVEETCYDGNWTAVSCARYDEGGCPCPEGEEKCGAEVDIGWPGYCTPVCCDWETEETCYDVNGISCAKYVDGGCPCAENQTKCGAFEGYPGYCANVCCDDSTEETCYDEYYNPVSCVKIAEGGCPCPEGEEKCGADADFGWPGYCSAACCDDATEETCYDENYIPSSCAKITDGGCPCPDGEEKCGADVDFGWPGYCTALCCDSDEETCYDENYSPTSCAKIDEGGCPCPDGEEKCGADVDFGWPGYCTAICCDWETEETCYDENWYPISCAKFDEGGCPSNTSYDQRKSQIAAFIQTNGGDKEIALFHLIKSRKVKMLDRKTANEVIMKQLAAVEEIALFQSITQRVGNVLTNKKEYSPTAEEAALSF